MKKDFANNISVKYEKPEKLVAPIKAGDVVGKVVFEFNDEKIGESEIFATESIGKISYWDIFARIFKKFLIVQ